jgi:transposase InsO family protein
MIMVIGSEQLSLLEMEAFLEASASVGFAGESRAAIYRWSESLLCHQEYGSRNRRAKGVIRGYMERMTGMSRAQCARLIRCYTRTGRVVVQPSQRRRFPRRYTLEDVALLARVDRAHERLSGPATQHLLKREFEVYGNAEYERLATISNGHLYNLRRSPGYRRQTLHYEETRPAAVSIGERRKPQPNGKPGYLRIDTVHQGDGPEGKGLYHINAVDEVTQWEIVLAVARISEAYLLPVLRQMLRLFPFRILGFHSDNGSEYVNQVVAGLLKKLLIEQTKSRARHSGDNGLVETKNAAIVRKHMGFGYIAPGGAERVNQFYTAFLNPYVNFHRPSAQPEVHIDARGRKRRLYKKWLTPLEKLLSLDKPEQYLRPGRTLAALRRAAGAISDTEAALRLQRARDAMFAHLEQAA